MAEETPKPKKPIYKRWWVWVLGFVVLIIIISASGDPAPEQSSTTTTKLDSSTQVQPAAVETPTTKVTATQMLADYEANEVAADQKYKGNMVEVSGTIKNIGKDILDTPYVETEN